MTTPHPRSGDAELIGIVAGLRSVSEVIDLFRTLERESFSVMGSAILDEAESRRIEFGLYALRDAARTGALLRAFYGVRGPDGEVALFGDERAAATAGVEGLRIVVDALSRGPLEILTSAGVTVGIRASHDAITIDNPWGTPVSFSSCGLAGVGR